MMERIQIIESDISGRVQTGNESNHLSKLLTEQTTDDRRDMNRFLETIFEAHNPKNTPNKL